MLDLPWVAEPVTPHGIQRDKAAAGPNKLLESAHIVGDPFEAIGFTASLGFAPIGIHPEQRV